MPITEPKIRSIYQPRGKEKTQLKRVYDRFEEMKNTRQDNSGGIETKWDTWEKNWEAYRKEKEEGDWQTNYFVPLTTAIIEQLLAEMVDQTPRPLILPRGPEDKARATVMRHIFEFTWDIADGDIELYKVIKDALIFGTGIAQEFFWKDRRLVQKLSGMKNKKGKKVPQYTEIETFDYDDCYMEAVKLQEFFVDGNARDINKGPFKARDCIRRYIMDIDDVRTFFRGPVWDPLDNVKYVKKVGRDINYYEFFKPPQELDDSRQVEVLWYWSRRPDDALLIVANDVLIRMGPNPYKHKQLPFARAVDVMRAHHFYGKG